MNNRNIAPNHLLACKLAQAGMPVFPCFEKDPLDEEGNPLLNRSGKPIKAKSPRTPNGFKDATTDLDRVNSWWSRYPDAVVGMPTGEASGIAVIDGDLDKETLEPCGERDLVDLCLQDDKAVAVRTQSGGIQLLFRHVDGANTSNKQVSSYIDTRGEGGYVIAPGSLMANGSRYEYLGRSMSAALKAQDLAEFPLEKVNQLIALRKEQKRQDRDAARTERKQEVGIHFNERTTQATDAETLDALRGILAVAPNVLDRNDWVKLAVSLRVAFGQTLRDDFVGFSLRYCGGNACTEAEATHVWNSSDKPKTVTSIGPAMVLLKDAVGEAEWKAAWKAVYDLRDQDGRSADSADQDRVASAEGDCEPPPEGFKLTKVGIYRKIDDKEGNADWRWLCSPIRVLALPRGADGKGWGRLVEIQDPDGTWHRWSVPAELFAGDGTPLRSEAMRLGLDMDASPQGRYAFSQMLQRWRPKARATTTERLGWADDACKAFILGTGEALGGRNVVFQSEHMRSAAAEMHGKGSTDDWKDNVGRLCIGNPLAVMAVSLAFSGPLLEPTKHEGGGLHLRGESSRGKSTILRAAVSVWGAPGFLQSWRATTNGLEGVAVACNGSLVALDEMSEVPAKEAGGAVYMLANGTGKARANRAGNARQVARWRTAILSSGELSLADKMAEGGQRKRAGQDVRLIDIQADARTFGAFDNLHSEKDGATFAERMNIAAAGAYGIAGPAFVAHMLEDMQAATATAREISAEFVNNAVAKLAPDADGQVKRVLGRIGLIVAAGEMATSLGLTGWPESEAVFAGFDLAEAWLAGRGGSGAQEARDAIQRTRAFIVAHGDARFEDLDVDLEKRPRTINRAGWKQSCRYYVAGDAWAEIHAGTCPTHAARAVRDAGFLMQEDANRLRIHAPRHVEGRPRCYCIRAEIMGGGDA